MGYVLEDGTRTADGRAHINGTYFYAEEETDEVKTQD
jgi:hypothetical protein